VGGRQDTPAYLLKDLKGGHTIPGPAILIDDISTVVVEPLCTAHITANQDIRIEVTPITAAYMLFMLPDERVLGLVNIRFGSQIPCVGS
jgi:hypothetical protein